MAFGYSVFLQLLYFPNSGCLGLILADCIIRTIDCKRIMMIVCSQNQSHD